MYPLLICILSLIDSVNKLDLAALRQNIPAQ